MTTKDEKVTGAEGAATAASVATATAANEVIEVEAQVIDEPAAKKHLEAGYEKAKKLLEDKEKLEETLLRLEKKLKELPVFGETLSDVPVLVMLVRDYVSKEYDKAPLGSIVAAISAIMYVTTPVDLIPDFIPVAGVVDDVAVVAVCMKLIASDVDEYRAWRLANGKDA